MDDPGELFLKSVDEMMFLISHRVRRPIVSALGLFRLLIADDASAEEKQKAFEYLSLTIKEMDECTEELIVTLDKVRKSIHDHRNKNAEN